MTLHKMALAALAATTSLMACATPPAPHIPPQASPSLSGPSFDTSGLYPAEGDDAQAPRTLHILHTNDMHGQVHPRRGKGGVHALAGYVNKVRQEQGEENVLLLDAGDVFTGTPEGSLPKGVLMAELMNSLRYDAMALGNHDFDQGAEVLGGFGDKASFPILAANLLPLSGPVADRATPHVSPITIVERAGVKIGIIGLLTPETPHITHKDAAASFEFGDPSVAVRDALGSLKAEGAQFAVILSHMGQEQEKALADTLDPALVPLVLGGHSHTAIDPMYKAPGSGVAYLQTGAHLSSVSHTTLTITPEGVTVEGGHLVPLNAGDWSPDPELVEVISRYSPEIEKVMGQEVGKCETGLTRQKEGFGSSSLGNLIGDAMRGAAKADVALQNKTGIRAELDAGTVTVRSLFEVEPFGNGLVNLKLTGAQLREIFEYAAQDSGLGLEVSGAYVVYDLKQPQGKRVTSLKVQGRPVEDKKTYTVATNSFLAEGGGQYPHMASSQHLPTGTTVRDAIQAWIQGEKGCSYDRSPRIKEQ